MVDSIARGGMEKLVHDDKAVYNALYKQYARAADFLDTQDPSRYCQREDMEIVRNEVSSAFAFYDRVGPEAVMESLPPFEIYAGSLQKHSNRMRALGAFTLAAKGEIAPADMAGILENLPPPWRNNITGRGFRYDAQSGDILYEVVRCGEEGDLAAERVAYP